MLTSVKDKCRLYSYFFFFNYLCLLSMHVRRGKYNKSNKEQVRLFLNENKAQPSYHS